MIGRDFAHAASRAIDRIAMTWAGSSGCISPPPSPSQRGPEKDEAGKGGHRPGETHRNFPRRPSRRHAEPDAAWMKEPGRLQEPGGKRRSGPGCNSAPTSVRTVRIVEINRAATRRLALARAGARRRPLTPARIVCQRDISRPGTDLRRPSSAQHPRQMRSPRVDIVPRFRRSAGVARRRRGNIGGPRLAMADRGRQRARAHRPGAWAGRDSAALL
jgi:hypothetical protein